MAAQLQYLELKPLQLRSGKRQDVTVSYQTFGRTLHSAPIVLVTHALTGNSSVMEWWSAIVGAGKAIDTDRFTVLALDIPGNGYSGDIDHLVFNYQDWSLYDVGSAFAKALSHLGIHQIELAVGGSIGGALLWELAVQQPTLIKTIVPIAADWKATDWLLACTHVQHGILNSSERPVELARQHAMTFYRTPQSLGTKFNREQYEGKFKVYDWLDYHGLALKQRFMLPAYKLMNHLLASNNAAADHNNSIAEALKNNPTAVELVAIDTDGFFPAAEDRATHALLKNRVDIDYHEIQSPHGHDAFLIEHHQVSAIIQGIIDRRVTTSEHVAELVASS